MIPKSVLKAILFVFIILFLTAIRSAASEMIPAPASDTTYRNDTMYVLVPEFYELKQKGNKDTTYDLKCYDSRDSVLNSWSSFDDVHYVSIFKNYTDYKHTYRDQGHDLPLPVSVIVTRYDKTGPGKWLGIDYATHKYRELKEDKNTIVKTVVNRQRLLMQRVMPPGYEVHYLAIIYKYYKVSDAKN